MEKIKAEANEKEDLRPSHNKTPNAQSSAKGIFNKQRAIQAASKHSVKSTLSEEPSRKNIFKASRGEPGFAELTGPKGTKGLLNDNLIQKGLFNICTVIALYRSTMFHKQET